MSAQYLTAELQKRMSENMRDGTHPAGCTYGGFVCGYWLVAEGCELEHWEEHFVDADGRCACGNEFPGEGGKKVYFDATEDSNA